MAAEYSQLKEEVSRLEAKVRVLQIELGDKAHREAELLRDLDKAKSDDKAFLATISEIQDLHIIIATHVKSISVLETKNEKLESRHKNLKKACEHSIDTFDEFRRRLKEDIEVAEVTRELPLGRREQAQYFDETDLDSDRNLLAGNAEYFQDSSKEKSSKKGSKADQGEIDTQTGKRGADPAPTTRPSAHVRGGSTSDPVSKRQKLQHPGAECQASTDQAKVPAQRSPMSFLSDRGPQPSPVVTRKTSAPYSVKGDDLSQAQKFHVQEIQEVNWPPKEHAPRSTGAASGHGDWRRQEDIKPAVGAEKANVSGKYKKVSMEEVNED